MIREKKRYFTNLHVDNYTDNKNLWKAVKPLFSNSGGGSQKITLVKDEKIISNDEEVAETFNQFFKTSIESLNITENRFLLNVTENLNNPVEIALKKFENHPSIIDIKRMVDLDINLFCFFKISEADIKQELQSLKTGKASTFMSIPTKHLKQVVDIIVEPLVEIWNNEIIDNLKFPSKLKYADITPIFKKLECILIENYRPVSLLPVVSKSFERIMQKQINTYIVGLLIIKGIKSKILKIQIFISMDGLASVDYLYENGFA